MPSFLLYLFFLINQSTSLIPPSSSSCTPQSVQQHLCPHWKPISPSTPPSATDGTKVVLTNANKNTGAACLDGSPPVFYYRPSSDTSAKTKYHIFFEGGGACVGITQSPYICFDSCQDRAGGNLGSSNNYPERSNYDNGYMSTNSNINPLTYNWNTIYIKYCDGAGHGGDNSTTVNTGKYILHFRGRRNMQAVFQELINNYGFADATDVLVSGCSAGGVAVYAHAEYIRDTYVPKTANYLAMSDSGFFLEVESRGHFVDANYWIYINQNTSASMNPKCVDAYPNDEFQCDFAQNTAPFINVPFFALQSRYDAWQTTCIIDTGNDQEINEYGQNFTDIFMSTFINGGNYHELHGAFLDSCHHHCGEWGQMHVNGMDQAQAQVQFWNSHASGDQHLWFQNYTYPCSSCCND